VCHVPNLQSLVTRPRSDGTEEIRAGFALDIQEIGLKGIEVTVVCPRNWTVDDLIEALKKELDKESDYEKIARLFVRHANSPDGFEMENWYASVFPDRL
jgi:hypothetical protein